MVIITTKNLLSEISEHQLEGMSTIGSPGKGGVPTTDSGCQPPRATQGHSLSVKVIATPARHTRQRHPRLSCHHKQNNPLATLIYRNESTRYARTTFLAWETLADGYRYVHAFTNYRKQLYLSYTDCFELLQGPVPKTPSCVIKLDVGARVGVSISSL